MALSELQVSIMRELGKKGGVIERKSVTVVDPTNQNSYLGDDVGELRLLPFGVGYLRTLQ